MGFSILVLKQTKPQDVLRLHSKKGLYDKSAYLPLILLLFNLLFQFQLKSPDKCSIMDFIPYRDIMTYNIKHKSILLVLVDKEMKD